jgi:hypothetical protein
MKWNSGCRLFTPAHRATLLLRKLFPYGGRRQCGPVHAEKVSAFVVHTNFRQAYITLITWKD